MRKFLLFFVLLILTANLVNAQYWEWAKELNISGHILMTGDSAGNIFIGQNNHVTKVLTLFKYNSSGNLKWQKQLNGQRHTPRIRASNKGEVYLTSSSENKKIHLLEKLNKNGLPLWSITLNDTGTINLSEAHIDQQQNIWITGSANPGTTLGTHTFKRTGLFIAQLSPNGNIIKTYQAEYGAEGWAIGTDSKGQIYVMGGYCTSFLLGNGLGYETENCYYGMHFVARFNTTLKPINLTGLGSNYYSPHANFTVDKDGSIFMSKWGRYSGFSIKKFDFENGFVWNRRISGTYGGCYGLSLDRNQNLYATGYISPGAWPTTFFAWKLNGKNGEISDHFSRVSDKDIAGSGLSIDASGRIYFLGTFSDKANFGKYELNNQKGSHYLAKANPFFPYSNFIFEKDTLCKNHIIQFYNRSLNTQP